MSARWGKLQMAGVSALKQLFLRPGAKTYPLGLQGSLTRSHGRCEPVKSFRRLLGSSVYFTAIENSADVEYSKCVSLEESFKQEPSRHYDSSSNLKAITTVMSFSKVSQDIFRQLARIAFDKALHEKKYFSFDASKILLKHEGPHTIVFVPENQLCENKQTIYVDRVVGPVAELMYNVYLGSNSAATIDPAYKEILDLMHLSQNGLHWWDTLDDILSHPVYWSNEQKFAALASAAMQAQSGATHLKHGITKVTARTRKYSDTAFVSALGNNNFYLLEYTVKGLVSGEHEVTRFVDSSKSNWKYYFWKVSFGPGYQFGKLADPDHIRMLKFVRNIPMHFSDKNFDAFARTLRRETLLSAVIELDRVFSLSLSIFHAMRSQAPPGQKLPKDLQDLFDMEF